MSEIVRLQHDLDSVASAPSRVRFTLRAYLTDNTTRQVLATREFDESAATTSETPYGAVRAANQAVGATLAQLAAFCAETSANWQRGVKRDKGH